MSEAAAEAALIWCPFEHEDAAHKVADALIDERLVACANIFPGMRSLFVWRGERDSSPECGALFKTTAPLLDATMQRLAELHPYVAPAITGWTVRAEAGTLAWLQEETGGA